MSGFLNLKPAGDAGDPLAPVAAWDSGDLSALASASWSDGVQSVGGYNATVDNSANCTSIGPDGVNGIKIDPSVDAYQYNGVYTSPEVSWKVADLLGETPQAGWLYVAQFVISSASSEPVSLYDGMIMGLREDDTTAYKAAGVHYISDRKSLFLGASSLGGSAAGWSSTLRTLNVFFLKGLMVGYQMSASVETTPFFEDDGATNTVYLTNPPTIDPTSANFELYWGSYVFGATTEEYILERARLWAFGK